MFPALLDSLMVGKKLCHATTPLHRKDTNKTSDKNLGLGKLIPDLLSVILATRCRNGEELCQSPEWTE